MLNLAPIVHQKKWDLVRVPMLRAVDGHYVVFVGDKMVRRYDDNTLPDVLKSNLAMVLASSQRFVSDHEVGNMAIYTNNQSPELDEIGWRVSDSYFCMVVSRDTLNSMKGGTLNGKNEALDTR